jgi:hypothetical protein
VDLTGREPIVQALGVGPEALVTFCTVDRELALAVGPGAHPTDAIPIVGLFRCWPAIDPKNCAVP